jgi:hypothetical protein
MSLVADLSERVNEECTAHLKDKAVQLCFRKRVVYIKVGGVKSCAALWMLMPQ